MDYSRTSPEAQALSSQWTPPAGVLGRILSATSERVDALLARRNVIERSALQAPAAPPFAAALREADVSVIAEIKRRSPSKGAINEGLSAPRQAEAYASGGARALSILTEPVHFGGRAADVEDVRQVVGLPLLKKDFHVHPVQLAEAKALGASAALLIVRAVPPALLRTLVQRAGQMALEVLVEVRSETELALALDCGATVIGVNARDLESLRVAPDIAERVIAHVPAHCVAIYESGVQTRDDVVRAARSGADAVLVGSSVSASRDPVEAVSRLTGVGRSAHARRP